MKVTAITQQVKDKNRYSIFVDDKYSFSLSQDGILSTGLRVGSELDDANIQSLKKQSEDDKLYHRLLGLLATRPRSRWELENYLERKKVDKETKQQLLNKLEEKQLINDADFAQRWVENRRLLKSMSQRKLRLELKQKRIAEDIINQVLAEDETEELEVLKELMQKKKNLTKYKTDPQKFMQYLARQGFNYGDIKTVLEE